ncbi:hypothetical protein E2C01_004585 [Portunus trituberculatus]|uniref:Uncharacterized protein n=1 Tax=Portunus trituberculatus TaxID=210409 RepID=A0A5B7CR30_PORTR|nr:hypothetical protein [Portunus trituberculatus]
MTGGARVLIIAFHVCFPCHIDPPMPPPPPPPPLLPPSPPSHCSHATPNTSSLLPPHQDIHSSSHGILVTASTSLLPPRRHPNTTSHNTRHTPPEPSRRHQHAITTIFIPSVYCTATPPLPQHRHPTPTLATLTTASTLPKALQITTT